jgi:hypothetical protein
MKTAPKKTAKRKPTKVPAGIHIKRNSRGFVAHIHYGNGKKGTAITGFNTKQNVLKGLLALNIALNEAYDKVEGKYKFTDHTVVAKKVGKKK